MAILNIFSKRQKKLRGEVPDVYQYIEIPNELRVQVIHIWKDAFGDYVSYSKVPEVYKSIYDTLCREYGCFRLNDNDSNPFEGLATFLLSSPDYEKVLDVIELTFKYIDGVCRDYNYRYQTNPKISSDSAIQELNQRFQEHGVGYQYEATQLIRMDSKLIHTEVIKPALVFLQKPEYKGANEEFLKAHEHYRRGRCKECLNECLKALESTLKSICRKKGWVHKDTDTANTLINTCFQNNIIPQFLQSEFTSLRSTLESGVPTTRNTMSGHGQGINVIEVPPYLAAYLLHLTGSSIILLIEAAS